MTVNSEPPVAVVDGPKGSAEIFEIWDAGKLVEYEVRYQNKVEKYANIGEAYIEAGEKVGVKT
jgi:hypothetical protein